MAIFTLWPYHASFMILGFVCLTTGMLIARYLKTKQWWLKVHKTLGIVGALFALAGLSMSLYMVSVTTGQHFAVPHAYLGIIAIVFVCLMPIFGYAQLKITTSRATISAIHRWAGRITLVLIFINMLSGLWLVGVF